MKKQHKRNQFTRMALALLLILSMLGNTLIFPTVAQETVAPVDNTTSSETPSADESTTDAISTPTLPEPILLTAADIPEFISAAALTERGAVERMRSEETNMSSVIFRNSDGTRTMYMYGLPVKYTAADGTVRDKSTNLVSVSTASVLLTDQPVAQTMSQMSLAQQEALQAELGILDVERAADTLHMLSTALTARQRSLSDMAYTTLDNDVYALFPTNLAKGMTLVFGEHSVRMTPAGTGLTVTAGGNVTKTTTSSLSDADVTERLLYPNAFGLGTAVQYTPTLTGVKEEILLSRNVGKNSFAFLMETGSLVLTEQNGQFVLIDPETEQQLGKLGEIIVFDSAGQIVRGNMTAQTILAGQKYGITISVDQEFLASATYPVSIDPTCIIKTSDDYTKPIEDIGIYNMTGIEGYTFDHMHQIGKVISTGYSGQAVFRFPALYDELTPSPLQTINSNEIYSFTLQLKTGNLTETSNFLFVNPYELYWCAAGRICDPEYYDLYDDSQYNIAATHVPIDSIFSIDITPIAKEWIDQLHGISDYDFGSPETGIVIRNSNPNMSCWLEASATCTDVYAVVDYAGNNRTGTFYLNNAATRTFLGLDSENSLDFLSGTIAEIGNSITWGFVYQGNEEYSIHPSGDTSLFLDEYGDIMTTPASGNLDTWQISFGSCGVEIRSVQSGWLLGAWLSEHALALPEDDFSTVESGWRMMPTSQYVEFPDVADVETIITPTQSRYENLRTLINSNNASWCSAADFSIDIYSSNATYDGRILTVGEATGSAVFYVTHLPSGKDFKLSIKIQPMGVFRIENAGQCIRTNTMAGLAMGTPVAITNSEIGNQLWGFTYLGNGEYKITSLGVRDSYYTDQMALTAMSDGSVYLQYYDASNAAQRWILDYSDTCTCLLYNVAFPAQALSNINGSIKISNSPSMFSINNLDLPDCTHNELDLFSGDMFNFDINIDSTAITDETPENVINTAALVWNNLIPNLRIYGSNETEPIGSMPIYVCGDDTKQESTWLFAVTDRALDEITLYLYKKDPLRKSTDITIQKVISHEVGHAIGLRHPSESGFADTDEENSGNESILSIMNQYSVENNSKITIYPSVFDIVMLMNQKES